MPVTLVGTGFGFLPEHVDSIGGTQYTEMGLPFVPPPGAGLSSSTFLRITDCANAFGIGGEIVSKYDSTFGGGGSWAFEVLNTGQVVLDVLGPASASAISAETLNPLAIGTWQHVAGTFDTTTQAIAVYIDGVAQETTCYNGDCGTVTSIEQSSASVLIGAYDGGTAGFWSGLIDEVQTFRVALTPEQVAAIHDAGGSGVCPPAWRSSHRYFKGDEVHDPARHVQLAITGGVSGTTTPTWNDGGGTTSDGRVMWKDRGLER